MPPEPSERARVDCHPVLQFRIEWNLVFQVSLDVGPMAETNGLGEYIGRGVGGV